jgi:hypothetical protein
MTGYKLVTLGGGGRASMPRVDTLERIVGMISGARLDRARERVTIMTMMVRGVEDGGR